MPVIQSPYPFCLTKTEAGLRMHCIQVGLNASLICTDLLGAMTREKRQTIFFLHFCIAQKEIYREFL